MTDTSVLPIGALPSGWRTVPAWSLLRRTKRTGFADEELLSVYREHGVIPKTSREDNHNVESEDLSSYQLVQRGDLVMNKMKAWQGSVAVSEHQGIVSPAYFVYQFQKNVHSKYFHYLLRSSPYIAAYNKISKGVRVGQWDLEPQEFRKLPVVLPPLEEQRRIADHLDREIQQIDKLLAKQDALIATAGELRQAVIAERVTRGLIKNRETKNSGVDWLGQIPMDWQTMPLRALMQNKVRKNESYQSDNYLSLMANVGVIPYAEKGDVGNKAPEDLQKCKLVAVGDFVLNSMNFGIGSFGVSEYEGVCSTVYLILEPLGKDVSADFLKYIFSMKPFQKHAQSLGNGILEHRAAINWHDLKNLNFPVPPLGEQQQIADYLKGELELVDELVAASKRANKLLSLRKHSLIDAVVTGRSGLRSN